MTTNVVTKPRLSPAGVELARTIIAEVVDPATALTRTKVQGSALLEQDLHAVERNETLRAVQRAIGETELRCARAAVDVSRAKVERYRQGNAPEVAIAAVEATGADIEHEIIHGVPRETARVEASGQALTDECASARWLDKPLNPSSKGEPAEHSRYEQVTEQPARDSTLPPAVPFLLPATATYCAVCGERIAAKARVFAVFGDNDQHFGLVTTTLGEFAGSRERTVFLHSAICAKRYAMQWVDRTCAVGGNSALSTRFAPEAHE